MEMVSPCSEFRRTEIMEEAPWHKHQNINIEFEHSCFLGLHAETEKNDLAVFLQIFFPFR